MNAIELSERVRYVVDSEGNQSAVMIGIDDWNRLLSLLEDIEDAEEIRRARAEDDETISWEQAKVELGLNS
ncbi:MAG: hypothetical protein ACFE0I_07125 [Elainellaceae cyanobacterium]